MSPERAFWGICDGIKVGFCLHAAIPEPSVDSYLRAPLHTPLFLYFLALLLKELLPVNLYVRVSMSLHDKVDCLFRPEDKAFKMLYSSREESVLNTFDDFLNDDLFELSDHEDNKTLFDNDDDFLAQNLNEQSSECSIPQKLVARCQPTPPEPWRKGLWCLSQNAARPGELAIAKTRVNKVPTQPLPMIMHPSSNPVTGSASSPPWIPAEEIHYSSTSTTRAQYTPRTMVRPPFDRDKTLSPSPMYAQAQHNRLAGAESWQQDFQDFHLQLPQIQVPFSPPTSGLIPNRMSPARRFNEEALAYNATIAHNTLKADEGQHIPPIRPVITTVPYPIDTHLVAAQSTRIYNEMRIPQQGAGQEYGSAKSYDDSPWRAAVSENSNSSQYSCCASQSMVSSNHSPMYWPSNVQIPGPQVTPISTVPQYGPIMAPMPQRPHHPVLKTNDEGFQDGLGIQYSGMKYVPNAQVISPLPDITSSYPSLPPPGHPHFTQIDPFATPKRGQQYRTPSRSPSPSISPTNTTRVLRQRSPTRNGTDHQRRKSIHKNGPMKDKERDRDTKQPRTPKTPKSPGNGNGGLASLDFVNFTPKDSAKLPQRCCT